MAGLLSVFMTLMASEATWGVEMYKVIIIFINHKWVYLMELVMNLRCFQEWHLWREVSLLIRFKK